VAIHLSQWTIDLGDANCAPLSAGRRLRCAYAAARHAFVAIALNHLSVTSTLMLRYRSVRRTND
jgi:uncharacterized protein (UPF0212 family)